MQKKPIILFKGACFTVEYAIQTNGISESQEFIENLDVQKKVKILAIIKKYANTGIIRSKEKFKKIKGDIWEFKQFQTRILMYHCDHSCIALTHGFIKKSPKTPKNQIEKANRIIKEYDEIRKELSHECKNRIRKI